ncbi:MAG: hypothetical protein JWM28_839 [Chitinophagaceae bacterium]|nr:hypothetical protein [Chitinophagaceae bacterium]
MSKIFTKQRLIILQVFFFCIGFCVTQTSFAQTGIQPVTVVQTADRVPLYPFNDHPDSKNFVYPSVIRKNGSLVVFTARQYDILEMINGNGVLVLQQNIKGRTGRLDVPLKSGSSGINYVRLRNKETTIIQRVVIIE